MEFPESKYWKKIEIFLVKRRGANIYEIAQHLGVHWTTAEKEMKKLEDMGRVHSEDIGKSKVFFLNGVGEFQQKFELGRDHSLFVDTFVSPFGEQFVRIKETKRDDGKWKRVGTVIITKDQLKLVGEFLKKIHKKVNAVATSQ